MSEQCVLLVGEPETVPAVRDALAARDFEVRVVRPAEAAATLKSTRVDAIAVMPFADGASARFVAHLVQSLKSGCPPIVVSLGRRDPALRDQSLIAGAADVSVEGQPEDVASRVDTVASGWLRGTPRRAVGGAVRAQRGRQTVELTVTEADPTGLAVADAAGLVPGELLRLPVPVPGADLVAWVRVLRSDEGPGLRFVGLLPEERNRIIAAIQGRARTDASATPVKLAPAPTPVAAERASATLPPGRPPTATPTGPPAANVAASAAAPTAKSGTTAPTPSSSPPMHAASAPAPTPTVGNAPATIPPVRPAAARAPTPTSTTRVERTTSPGAAAVPPAPTPTSTDEAERTTSPGGFTPTPTATPNASDTSASVRKTVEPPATEATEPKSRPAADSTADESRTPSATPPATATPGEPPTNETSPAPASSVAAAALAPSEPAAPTVEGPPAPERPDKNGIGAAIGELLGDPSPQNFAAAPSSEADVLAALLDTALEHRWPLDTFEPDATLNALAMAASLGLASDEAGAPTGDVVIEYVRGLAPLERRFFEAEPPSEIPDHDLARRTLTHRLRLFAIHRDGEAKLKAGAKVVVDEQALSSLAQQTDELRARLQRIVDGFVAAGQPQKIKDVNQFQIAVTRALAEVRNVAARLKGETVAGGSAVLLDADEDTQGPARWTREAPKDVVEKKIEKPKFTGFEDAPAVRARKRAAWGVGFIVAGAAIAVLTWPKGPQPLPLEQLGNPPGITSVILQEEGTKARYFASADWKPDEIQLQYMRVNASRVGIQALVIIDAQGRLLAFSPRPDSPIRVVPPRR